MKTHIIKNLVIACLLGCFAFAAPTATVTAAASEKADSATQWADHLLKAHAQNHCIPVLAHRFAVTDTQTAYSVQKKVLLQRLKQETIAGFKAGFTSEGLQKRFGTDQPAAGVLTADGKYVDGDHIPLNKYNRPMLETEIGFVVGAVIDKPVADVAELRKKIKAVLPAIEIPDLCFDHPEKMTIADIVAANVSAAGFLTGKALPVEGMDLDAVAVTLTLDGKTVNTGKGSDCLGSQWEAALWLVNKVIAMGWTLKPGHILLTGAMGNMLPAKPGSYGADFGRLGVITFVVK